MSTSSAAPSIISSFRPSFTTSRMTASHTKQRSKVTALLLSLTIACIFLASTCSAISIPKIALQLNQQRSIAQQVHHVQVADESIHNAMILMKKSLQKQRQQKRLLQQEKHHQQQPKQESKKRRSQLQKREVEGEASLEFNAHAESESFREQQLVTPSSQHLTISPNTNHEDGRYSGDRKRNIRITKSKRARLISAYEAIVFSESQMPVFLSQDHRQTTSAITTKGRTSHQTKHAAATIDIVNDQDGT
ncbi:hypothetical protein BC939DRAFT_454210, partial [Gamsiella multidivaricata]|uniref:uncharacterized protein n=1 Tax=Gamsiella multidivaricata TaxID=101098 RepID=UPI0022200556